MIVPVSILEVERWRGRGETPALRLPGSRKMVLSSDDLAVWINAGGAFGRRPSDRWQGIDPVGPQQAEFISVLPLIVGVDP